MKLPKQLRPPKGVKYALTVPQSVLFADLSLQGNRRPVFKRVAGIDYEPAYISIDVGGAMSWNYDDDDDFDKAMCRNRSKVEAIEKFVDLMKCTTNELDEASKNIQKSEPQNLAKGLETYWRAYENHMTSLFTFWNVEQWLSDTLTAELKNASRLDEIKDGLARYLKPNKPNYFVKERIALKKLTDKFDVAPRMTLKNASQELVKALENHRDSYEFLITPFNLGDPLSLDALLERAKEVAAEPTTAREAPDDFKDLSPGLKRLAVLAQEFTFWKSERLDMFSLADSRVKELYRKVATELSLDMNDLFSMTRDEIMQSLETGKAVVGKNALGQRQKAYGLILYKGRVDFYEPSPDNAQQVSDDGVSELTGVSASAGVAKGKARLIKDLKDAKDLHRGEVLVTAMTRPEMGAALDRASAFVTDEGGMLCHAAIISREMKKPCIIATENATKVLKNGQKIEVDGTKGIVKVLAN